MNSLHTVVYTTLEHKSLHITSSILSLRYSAMHNPHLIDSTLRHILTSFLPLSYINLRLTIRLRLRLRFHIIACSGLSYFSDSYRMDACKRLLGSFQWLTSCGNCVIVWLRTLGNAFMGMKLLEEERGSESVLGKIG